MKLGLLLEIHLYAFADETKSFLSKKGSSTHWLSFPDFNVWDPERTPHATTARARMIQEEKRKKKK